MTKYRIPLMVQQHFDQMINTMEMLESAKFATLIIIPKILVQKEKQFTISWSNQIFQEGVNAKNFSAIDSYQKVLTNRSFQILLFDNSVIRCSLQFKDDILVTQNFSWIPCPLSFDSYQNSIEFEPELISEEIMDEKYDKNRILMRSTVRFDYDSSHDAPDHPSSHMHFQNSETRINTDQPMCFNTFVKHVIETYYPKSYYVKKNIVPEEVYDLLSLDKWQGLSFKTFTDRKKKIQYLSGNKYSLDILVMG